MQAAFAAHGLVPPAARPIRRTVGLPLVDRWDDNRGARNRPIAVTVTLLIILAAMALFELPMRGYDKR